MGFSTPKPKFDLAEFLSQKGTVKARRPDWKRSSARAAAPAPDDRATEDGATDGAEE
jgi:hypothetical protein